MTILCRRGARWNARRRTDGQGEANCAVQRVCNLLERAHVLRITQVRDDASHPGAAVLELGQAIFETRRSVSLWQLAILLLLLLLHHRIHVTTETLGGRLRGALNLSTEP
jgi:hypothetical protein